MNGFQRSCRLPAKSPSVTEHLLKRFAYPTIHVHDLNAAVKTYSELLGIKPFQRDAESCFFALQHCGLKLAVSGDVEGVAGLTFTDSVPQPLSLSETLGVPIDVIVDADWSPPTTDTPAVDHVVIQSTDAEATRELYQDQFGLRLALDKVFESRKMRILFFRISGVTLEVSGSLGSEEPSGDRLWGLAYRVRDIDASRSRLTASGFDVSEVRDGMKPGTRVATVRRETHGVPTLLIGDPSRD